MAEFGGGLALQELHVIDQQQIDAPQPFLEAQRRLALHRGDEMVHEMVGGQVDDVAAGLSRPRRPGDGIEQMGFAQANGRMHIDRIETDRAIGNGACYLFGNPEGNFIRRAGDEGVEGHLGIEGTAGERIALQRTRFAQCAARNGRRLALRFRRSWLDGGGHARPRLAIDPDGQMEPRDDAGFRAKGLENLLGVVGLDPRTKEPRRHR